MLLALLGCAGPQEPAPASVEIAPAPSGTPSADPGEAPDAPGAPDPEEAAPAPKPSSAPAPTAPPATPPPGSPNAIKAQQLFDEAKRDMQAGDLVKACAKFEASLNLDFGLGTLANLAQCEEMNGNKAKACKLWGQAAAEALSRGESQRAKMAATRRIQLGCGP